jgi:hypothetical protein
MQKLTGLLMAITALVVQPSGARSQQPPASLVDVGEFGENIYDLAKAKDWANVGQKMKALEDAAKKLASDLKGAEAGQKRLGMTLKALGKAVTAKDEQATKREANQVTLIAADLIEPFNPEVPAAVTRLDYYGRELEIWVLAKDTAKLKATGDAMRKAWEKLQAAVKTKGGNAEAKRFNRLMDQVTAAKTVDDYARITTPILDEVDNLEKVFKKK